jgi:hypothetical protein
MKPQRLLGIRSNRRHGRSDLGHIGFEALGRNGGIQSVIGSDGPPLMIL